MKIIMETDPDPADGTPESDVFQAVTGRVARDPGAKYVYVNQAEWDVIAGYLDDLFGTPEESFVLRQFMGREIKKL